MASKDVIKREFRDVRCALRRVALNRNRNTVFIWSLDMCFIFFDQINVIFMRPHYEAVIWCDCIIKLFTSSHQGPSHVPAHTLVHYILDLNPSTVSAETASSSIGCNCPGGKGNFQSVRVCIRTVVLKGMGWDLVLLFILLASDRYLLLSVVTRLLCIL